MEREESANDIVNRLTRHEAWHSEFIAPVSSLHKFHRLLQSGLSHEAEEYKQRLAQEQEGLTTLKAEQQRVRSGQMTVQEVETRLKSSFYKGDEYDPKEPKARLDRVLDLEMLDYLVEIDSIEWALKDIETSWTLYSSYMIATILHSQIEVSLHRFCDLAAKQQGIMLSLTDLKKQGGPIGQAELYITKVLKLNWPKGEQVEELKALSKLRNAIVHKDGVLEGEKKFPVIDKHFTQRVLSIDDEGRVVFGEDYLAPIIGTAQRFFDSLRELNQEVVDSFIAKSAKHT